MNKNALTVEIIQMLKPIIKKALLQTSNEHREDLEQELYLKIVKKISQENTDNLPDFFEVLEIKK